MGNEKNRTPQVIIASMQIPGHIDRTQLDTESTQPDPSVGEGGGGFTPGGEGDTNPPTNSITPLQTRTLYRYNMYSHTYWVSQLFQGRNTRSANFSKATKPSKARFEKEVRKGFRAAQSKHGGGIRRQAPGISSNVNCSGTIRRNRLTQRRSVISLDTHDLPECACLSLLRSVLDPRIVHVPRQSFANLERVLNRKWL